MDIVHDETARTFRMHIDGALASLRYELDHGIMSITHTNVPEALAGRGVGSALVRAALDAARGKGWKVIPACPFAEAWMRRHPETADLRAGDGG
jgi:predicted GNAT family acetyltransferase